MKYKYGNFEINQFIDYKKRLHSLIHWFLVYADDNDPALGEYFIKVQYKLNGLNELLNYPTQLVEIINLVESARIEYNKDKENFNHKLFRKTFLDIHELIDKIPIGDE